MPAIWIPAQHREGGRCAHMLRNVRNTVPKHPAKYHLERMCTGLVRHTDASVGFVMSGGF